MDMQLSGKGCKSMSRVCDMAYTSLHMDVKYFIFSSDTHSLSKEIHETRDGIYARGISYSR